MLGEINISAVQNVMRHNLLYTGRETKMVIKSNPQLTYVLPAKQDLTPVLRKVLSELRRDCKIDQQQFDYGKCPTCKDRFTCWTERVEAN